jgi:Fe-S-cluster containining protein
VKGEAGTPSVPLDETAPASFPCTQCGLCCRALRAAPEGRDLDRGDGVCRYLSGTLCGIYESRPLICNVEALYKVRYADTMSWVSFVRLNLRVCQNLTGKRVIA